MKLLLSAIAILSSALASCSSVGQSAPKPCPDPGAVREYAHVSNSLQFPDLSGQRW
jgi:hypothetical protein